LNSIYICLIILFNNLKFADSIDLLKEDRKILQGNLERIYEAGEVAGLHINTEKTMTMAFGQDDIEEELKIRGRNADYFTEFICLGSLQYRTTIATRRSRVE
jgi:hypothetical protein